MNDNMLRVAAKFQAPFPSTLHPPKSQRNGYFVPRPFPRSETMGVLGIKVQLRTWLWQDLKQLTACSVLHPAPRSGKKSKVELWSPHFPPKLDFWKEAVSFLLLCSAKDSWNLVACTLEPLNYLVPMIITLKLFLLSWDSASLHGIPAHTPFHTLLTPVTALSRTTEHLRQNGITWDTGITWSKPSAQSTAGCRELCPVLNISKEGDSTYDNHGTELFQQENGLHSSFINLTSKSNSSTCKNDST